MTVPADDGYATIPDVEARFERALTADERRILPARLTDALDLLVGRVPRLHDRVADGTLSTTSVKRVQVDMVLRLLRNPDGWRQESIDDWSGTRDRDLSAGQLHVTDGELATLMPAGRRVPGTIRLGVPAELQ